MKLFGRSLSSRGQAQKTRILSVLDVGSSKVVCMIVRLIPCDHLSYLYGRTHQIEILGFGCQRSRGVKGGVVVDLEEAERSIRLAVDAAERMAGLIIDSLIVSISSSRVKSAIRHICIDLFEKEVKEKNLEEALSRVFNISLSPSTCVLHVLPLRYYLDDAISVVDPVGMAADRLGIDVHVLTVDSAPLRNLELCINRAHLSVEAVVAAPFASGISSLMADEAQLGAVCIDLGADTTEAAVFMNGHFVHAEGIAVGGAHVTRDIAAVLSTNLREAEQVKLSKGSYIASEVGDVSTFSVNSFVSGEGHFIEEYSHSLLSNIIRARVKETIEILCDRLYQAGFGNVLRRCVVLTGGGSFLPGIVEGVHNIVGGKVRLGRPLGLSGMGDVVRGGAFSSAVGLLVYPQLMQMKGPIVCSASFKGLGEMGAEADKYSRSFLRVGKWFKESFG